MVAVCCAAGRPPLPRLARQDGAELHAGRFATLLLAYVGSRFVFEVVLHKGWA
jgi:hypothetical protein